MTKRFGFTLAEVLITLGIIGVVAAMTMPTLMNQTQGAQYKTAYKKALSALSQAVTLNVALDEWNFADADNSTYKIQDMLSSRMNVVRTETGNTNLKDAKGNDFDSKNSVGKKPLVIYFYPKEECSGSPNQSEQDETEAFPNINFRFDELCNYHETRIKMYRPRTQRISEINETLYLTSSFPKKSSHI